MYISKATFRPDKDLFTFLRKESKNILYTTHKLLWNIFPKDSDAKRDFLFRRDTQSKIPLFYIVSKRKPTNNPIFDIVTKEYNPKLKIGQKLAFSLNANPVVVKRLNGMKKHSRHNVWVDAKKSCKDMKLNPQEIRKVCEKRTKEWLVSRSEKHGFSVDEQNVFVDGYTKHHLYKVNNRKNVRFSSVYFEGILIVSNVDLLCKCLFEGIGKSKAFGYGLLLVKRI